MYYTKGDYVTFNIGDESYKYQVHRSHLGIDTHRNSIIFNKLSLNSKVFCQNSYGYPVRSGYFPECKVDDYEALNRVIEDLKRACDKYAIKEVKKEKNTGIYHSSNKRDLGDEIRAKYPRGTIIKPVGSKGELRSETLYIIKEDTFDDIKTDYIDNTLTLCWGNIHPGYIYACGNWAQIVNADGKELKKPFDDKIDINDIDEPIITVKKSKTNKIIISEI